MNYIHLTYGDLILPALLVVMDGALSIVLRLRLERQLAIATLRMVLQLILVGYVLTFLFAAISPLWTALAAFIMALGLQGLSHDRAGVCRRRHADRAIIVVGPQ